MYFLAPSRGGAAAGGDLRAPARVRGGSPGNAGTAPLGLLKHHAVGESYTYKSGMDLSLFDSSCSGLNCTVVNRVSDHSGAGTTDTYDYLGMKLHGLLQTIGESYTYKSKMDLSLLDDHRTSLTSEYVNYACADLADSDSVDKQGPPQPVVESYLYQSSRDLSLFNVACKV